MCPFTPVRKDEIIMKLIEKISLALFSTLILIISVIFCLLIFGWLDINFMTEVIKLGIGDPVISKVILGLSILFILMATICIFFGSNDKQKNDYKNGILLQNSEGKLLITKETIENIVKGVIKGFDSAEVASTKIEVDKENNVIVFVNLIVKENAVIKELSTNLQTKVKEAIKKATDLEAKEVNIKVKNIEPVKEIVQE